MAIVQFVETGSTTSAEEEKALVRRSLTRLEKNLDASLGKPASLASDVQALIGGVQGNGGVSVIGGLKALRKIFKTAKQAATVATTTASRIQQVQNQGAIQALFAQTAVVEMANVAKDLDYDSANEALAIRDEVADLLEEEAKITENDATYSALMKLRAGVSRDLTTRAADLSRVETTKPPMMTNAILESYRLYGQADRDQEIADRNNLAMPGFVSPAESLQVLNA